MVWFKRSKKPASSAAEMEALADEVMQDYVKDSHTKPSGPQFWLDHGYENGDRVECAVCGTPLTVRLIRQSSIILGTMDAHTGSPLICGDCGRLFCVECSLRLHPNRPSCDRCKQVGGVTSLMRK